MARGGARPGAGRPKGPKPAADVAKAEKVLKAGAEGTRKFQTALDFAMDSINDPGVEMADKIRLAVAAMPFQHPKLEPKGAGKKEEKDFAAKEAAVGKFASPAPPKLIVNNK